MRSNRVAGFTLIEMLVVIGVIAILAAILFPVFSRARIKAREAKCTTNLHSIVMALKQYYQDYQAYPMWPTWNPVVGRFVGGVSALYPDYITDAGVLICPDDTTAVTHMKDAKNAVYSSYNADIDFSAFMSNPSSFLDTDGAGNTYLKNRLYNYFGYTDNYSDTAGSPYPYGYDGFQVATFIGPENGSALPWWLAEKGFSWRYYPRLMNNYAPDITIVTHCTRHRQHYDQKGWKDVVIHLGGDANTAEDLGLAQTITPSGGGTGTAVSDWVHQRY